MKRLLKKLSRILLSYLLKNLETYIMQKYFTIKRTSEINKSTPEINILMTGASKSSCRVTIYKK